MPNPIRPTRRAILLGVIVALAFLGLSFSRPVSKAQEPKASRGQSLRDQVCKLRAEIDLLEVEHEVARHLLSESIKEERACLDKLENAVVLLDKDLKKKAEDYKKQEDDNKKKADNPLLVFINYPEETNDLRNWGGMIWHLFANNLVTDAELRQGLSGDFMNEGKAELVETFGKTVLEKVESLEKIKDEKDFSEARKRLADLMMDEIKNKAIGAIRPRVERLKKEIASRSADLAGKKLDLADLERQYHQAR